MNELQEYTEYIERVKANGGKTLTATMPCCQNEVEFDTPRDGIDEWTGLFICPHCKKIVWRTVTRDTCRVEL